MLTLSILSFMLIDSKSHSRRNLTKHIDVEVNEVLKSKVDIYPQDEGLEEEDKFNDNYMLFKDDAILPSKNEGENGVEEEQKDTSLSDKDYTWEKNVIDGDEVVAKVTDSPTCNEIFRLESEYLLDKNPEIVADGKKKRFLNNTYTFIDTGLEEKNKQRETFEAGILIPSDDKSDNNAIITSNNVIGPKRDIEGNIQDTSSISEQYEEFCDTSVALLVQEEIICKETSALRWQYDVTGTEAMNFSDEEKINNNETITLSLEKGVFCNESVALLGEDEITCNQFGALAEKYGIIDGEIKSLSAKSEITSIETIELSEQNGVKQDGETSITGDEDIYNETTVLSTREEYNVTINFEVEIKHEIDTDRNILYPSEEIDDKKERNKETAISDTAWGDEIFDCTDDNDNLLIEMKEKDTYCTILLICIDSNQKFLNRRKLWTLDETTYKPCENIDDVRQVIRDEFFPDLKYILIHTGTTDIEHKSGKEVHSELMELTFYIRQKYPAVKIILSQITPRTDDRDKEVIECNCLIEKSVVDMDHITLVNHDYLRNTAGSYYYDEKHIHKNAIWRFAANIKRGLRESYGITFDGHKRKRNRERERERKTYSKRKYFRNNSASPSRYKEDDTPRISAKDKPRSQSLVSLT